MKLAGGSRLAEMNVDAFLDQAREYDAAEDIRDGSSNSSSPRGRPIRSRWSGSRNWTAGSQRLLPAHPHRRLPPAGHRYRRRISEEARSAARSYREAWERTSDPLVGTLRDVVSGAAATGSKIFDSMADRWRNGPGRRTTA